MGVSMAMLFKCHTDEITQILNGDYLAPIDKN